MLIRSILAIGLYLAFCAHCKADLLLNGEQRLRVDNNSGVNLDSTIDVLNSPVGSLLLNPNPGTSSSVAVQYSYAQTQQAASLSWSVDQFRGDAIVSSSLWSTTVTFTSDIDLRLGLHLTWDGLQITNGAAVIGFQIEDSFANELANQSGTVFSGKSFGSVPGPFSTTLAANETYTLSIQTFLFFLGDESDRQQVNSSGIFSLTLSAVPEPSSLLFVSLACSVVLFGRRSFEHN